MGGKPRKRIDFGGGDDFSGLAAWLPDSQTEALVSRVVDMVERIIAESRSRERPLSFQEAFPVALDEVLLTETFPEGYCFPLFHNLVYLAFLNRCVGRV